MGLRLGSLSVLQVTPREPRTVPKCRKHPYTDKNRHEGGDMSRKRKAERKKEQELQKRIDEIAKRRTFNRGNLVLLVTIIWLIGLVLIVLKYGKLG